MVEETNSRWHLEAETGYKYPRKREKGRNKEKGQIWKVGTQTQNTEKEYINGLRRTETKATGNGSQDKEMWTENNAIKRKQIIPNGSKKLYQELNGNSRTEKCLPDAEESKRFWSGIWGTEKKHNLNAELLGQIQRERTNSSQDMIIITMSVINAQWKKKSRIRKPQAEKVYRDTGVRN